MALLTANACHPRHVETGTHAVGLLIGVPLVIPMTAVLAVADTLRGASAQAKRHVSTPGDDAPAPAD